LRRATASAVSRQSGRVGSAKQNEEDVPDAFSPLEAEILRTMKIADLPAGERIVVESVGQPNTQPARQWAF
jgi:hypothetical protein